MNLSKLVYLAMGKFKLDHKGHHGAPHWNRVNQRGLELAKTTGANPKVVTCFAFLHDACRIDEHEDPQHGQRGADQASTLGRLGHLDLTVHEIVLLHDAIKHHSGGRLSDEPTIATCWDSDRLDLWRVGVAPAARFLSTSAAKAMLKLEMVQQLQGA
jgi:uncharacterized protein